MIYISYIPIIKELSQVCFHYENYKKTENKTIIGLFCFNENGGYDHKPYFNIYNVCQSCLEKENSEEYCHSTTRYILKLFKKHKQIATVGTPILTIKYIENILKNEENNL